MRREEIDGELKDVSFEYFYWFSRYEYSLKANGFLKNTEVRSAAEPGWQRFIDAYCDSYQPSDEAKQLMVLHPKKQIVGLNQELEWKNVGIEDCKSDLCVVVRMLKVIRNNLFHGGKHGDVDMDNKERNVELLSLGKLVLDQLAYFSGIEADYTRYY